MSLSETVCFHAWPQQLAQSILPTTLRPFLPHSNPLYNRILGPQNTPERQCLFAASFPPPQTLSSPRPTPPSSEFTILFSDRSRHSESQIWIFNPLIAIPVLTAAQSQTLLAHVNAAVNFIASTKIPTAPGWPFSPVLRFASVHERIAETLKAIASPYDALARISIWDNYLIDLSKISQSALRLPPGFTFARVPESQLDVVIATSSIPRQPATLLTQPNVGVLDDDGILVAWAYIGIDSSFATLYVAPTHRGKGLATLVAVELLKQLRDGLFAADIQNVVGEKSYDGKSGWVHSDVAATNNASKGVMQKIGGVNSWVSSYIWVDCEKLASENRL